MLHHDALKVGALITEHGHEAVLRILANDLCEESAMLDSASDADDLRESARLIRQAMALVR
jgi:hypothetical protein